MEKNLPQKPVDDHVRDVQEVKGESKPPEKERVPSTSNLESIIESMIPFVGTVTLTDEEKRILYAPVDEEMVEIRPDGLVYLPWMEYVVRLREAFGLSWAICPKGLPTIKGDLILWGWYLFIRGVLAGFAVGEQQYRPGNPTMTYGDALEGAKSNALMRLCKGLGISLELWRPSWVREWKKKWAMQITDSKGKKIWVKRNKPISDPGDEVQPKPQEVTTVSNGSEYLDAIEQEAFPSAEPRTPLDHEVTQPKEDRTKQQKIFVTDAQRKRFWAIAKNTGATDDEIKEFLEVDYGIKSTREIPLDIYEDVCEAVKTLGKANQT